MRKTYLILAVVMAAALLAACGSSSSGSSSSTPAASSSGSATAVATKGATINIGTLCSCSGPQAAVLAGIDTPLQAWADSVNAAGGLNGHDVKVYSFDDGSDAATSLQDVKQLVQQDHVVAIVGEYSLVDSDWAKYIASTGIPVIGGITPSTTFLTNPDFYPSGSQLLTDTLGVFALAKQAGKTHLGLPYCAESPVCAETIPVATAIGAQFGIKVTPVKISSTAPSYAAPCLELKSAGADALFVAANTEVVQRFVQQCAQQGYTPTNVAETNSASPSWKSVPALSGTLLSGDNANPLDPSLPAVAQFQKVMKKYDDSYFSSPQFSLISISVWAAAEMFADAAKAAKLTPTSTPADLKKGLYALKGETLGGLTGPVTFTPGKPAFVPCYFTLELKGGTFTSLNADKPTCISASQAAALEKAL